MSCTSIKKRLNFIYVNYFPELSWGIENFPKFYVNWDDPNFREVIQKMVSPKNSLKYTAIPNKDRISVALHARTGGGYENSLYDWDQFVLKLPCIPFLIRQLRYLYDFLENKPLYVYVFTDDFYPDLVMKQFQEALEDCDIIFECASRGLKKDHHVLEDFFSMTLFDCSIHSDSNFSNCAGFVKDYDVEIRPTNYELDYVEKKVLYIVKMRLHFDKSTKPTYQVIQQFSEG